MFLRTQIKRMYLKGKTCVFVGKLIIQKVNLRQFDELLIWQTASCFLLTIITNLRNLIPIIINFISFLLVEDW